MDFENTKTRILIVDAICAGATKAVLETHYAIYAIFTFFIFLHLFFHSEPNYAVAYIGLYSVFISVAVKRSFSNTLIYVGKKKNTLSQSEGEG